MPTKKAVIESRDPRVDDYIAGAAPFAREPLAFVREAMHAALPDVAEAIKWSHPFYLLDGRPFAGMAAFKAHCSLGFWAGARNRFDAFTAAQQREYVDWIVEAKRAATRASRIAQAVEWIAEGKTRNWKYQAC